MIGGIYKRPCTQNFARKLFMPSSLSLRYGTNPRHLLRVSLLAVLPNFCGKMAYPLLKWLITQNHLKFLEDESRLCIPPSTVDCWLAPLNLITRNSLTLVGITSTLLQ